MVINGNGNNIGGPNIDRSPNIYRRVEYLPNYNRWSSHIDNEIMGDVYRYNRRSNNIDSKIMGDVYRSTQTSN